VVLPDNASPERILHLSNTLISLVECERKKAAAYMYKLVTLSLEQILYGNPRRARYDTCNIIGCYALVEHRERRLIALCLGILVRELLCEVRNRRESQPAGLLKVALALREFQLVLCVLQLLL
jgi:hypothetical protein